MKKLMALVVALVLATAGLTPADFRIFTRPSPPSRDVLDRLGLTQAWTLRIPVQGQRDGLFSVQLIPAKDNFQLVVQTYSGAVLLLDAETGDTLWRTTVGEPFWEGQPVAYNSSTIFTTRRDVLYALNRVNGRQRLWTLDRLTGRPTYGFYLPHPPASAQPVADEDNVYFCLENRVTAYEVPNWGLIESASKEEVGPGKTDSFQPEQAWSYLSVDYRFERPPLWTLGQIGVVDTNGTFLSINKFKDTPRDSRIRFDYQFHKDVIAAMGQYGEIAYIGSEDATLYALNMVTSRLLWRFLSGSPILRQPAVTDKDVFVTTSRNRGMFRLDRETGREIWHNRDAEQYLAGNKKFLYATDRHGKFLVLDLARGITHARYDMSDYVLPISNELTDRIYFANHDGQILCLRHRDNVKPMRMKTQQAVKKPPIKPKEDKKSPEPKEENKKPPEPKGKKEMEKDARGLDPFRLQISDDRLQIAKALPCFCLTEDRNTRLFIRSINLQSAIYNLQSGSRRCVPGA
jgi:outer membrane protein assembly factor BamB